MLDVGEEIMKTLCFIPAKGNSVRLPGKNKKKLNGRPLVQWTIETALSVFRYDDIIVNTNDYEIETIALVLKVGVNRRTEVGDTIDNVLLEMLIRKPDWDTWKAYDTICILQCNSPFLKPYQIRDCLNIFEKHKCNSVVSVNEELEYNGAVCVIDKKEFLKHRVRALDPMYKYLMDAKSSLDIDTSQDWNIATEIAKSL